MVLSIISLKGGVGKTTSAVILAQVISETGRPVTLLDADPEASAKAWELLAERAEDPLGFPVLRGDPDGLVKQAKDLSRDGQWVVIDTPPNDKSILMSAAVASHLSIIPLGPTRIDVDRLGRTLAVLSDLREVRPDLEFRFLLTMYSRMATLSKTIASYLENYRVFSTRIRQLERYRRLFGMCPNYLDEYEAVWEEAEALLSEPVT